MSIEQMKEIFSDKENKKLLAAQVPFEMLEMARKAKTDKDLEEIWFYLKEAREKFPSLVGQELPGEREIYRQLELSNSYLKDKLDDWFKEHGRSDDKISPDNKLDF